MKLTTIGTPIAERRFDVGGKRGAGAVVVTLGKPRPFRGDQLRNYYCPYEIRGPDSAQIRYAGGVDAFQAIQLAMQMIGDDLRVRFKNVKWDAGTDGDLGFPSPDDRVVSPQMAKAFEDGMKRAIEAIRRRSKALEAISDRDLEALLLTLNDKQIARRRKAK